MSLEIVEPGRPPAPAYTPPPKRSSDPKAAVTVYFDFAAASVRPESIPQLKELATALKSGQLRQFRFAIVGHTDAKGGDRQNLRLSVQRAAAVFEILTARFGVPPASLFVQGQGMRNLQGDPMAAENRRVEIVNLF